MQPDGEALRDKGIQKVSINNQLWLERARGVAASVAAYKGSVTTDDLRGDTLIGEPGHPNAWGAVFRDKRFKPVGYTKSQIPSTHARMIRVWGLA